MKVWISLDNQGYRDKPKDKVPLLKKRVSKRWQEIELEKLADLVGNKGYAVIPGHMATGFKAIDCVAMQVFMLDFDKGVSFDAIKMKCEKMQLPIAFAYHTYTSTEEIEKFRIAFVSEYLIEDPFIIKIIMEMLYQLFPECDRKCRNLDRIFFGGKELIYDEMALCALVQIFSSFFDKINAGNNFKRNIKSFCKKNHILLVNDRPAMGEISMLSSLEEEITKIDGFMDSIIIHKTRETIKPSFFMIEGMKEHLSIKCRRERKRLDIKKNSGCQLLDDFNSGIVLEHNQKFAILTNLLYVYGGQKHFFEILNAYYDTESYEKWKKDRIYIKGYWPQRCSDEFCPYFESCENMGTMVDTLAMDRRIYRKPENYCCAEQAWENLMNNLKKALDCDKSGIHLIKAQTGLGKTTAYIQLIKENRGKNFLIALPTIKLREAVFQRMISAGIPKEELFMTKSVVGNIFFPKDVQEQVSVAHNQGLHNKTKKIVGDYYNEIKNNPNKTAIAVECQEILEGVKAAENARVIITTHTFFSNMPENFLRQYTIIIDEDIMYLHLLNRYASVSVKVLQALSKDGHPVYSKIASEMLQAEENVYYKKQAEFYTAPLTEDQLIELGCAEEDNVNDLNHAESYVKMKNRQTGEMEVKYYYPPKLPKMKYIVLSATINKTIYEKYFRNEMNIFLYPEMNAAYKGNLVQYTYHSLGRKDLSKKMQVFSIARELADCQNLEIITFKENSYLPDLTGMNSAGLHFGNSTGVNTLEGKTIGIIGTPYKAPETYKLIACYLGANVNQEIDERPKIRRVSYKKWSFLITTYEDPLLREIQLYSIESELEQCIGRARLLRKNCKVYLFSCFPCEQAEIHIKNYLI